MRTSPPPGTPIRWLPIEGNRQRLDGGAMFGNAPRAVWERWATPDALHRIDLACRALLLVEDTGRVVLCETGIGAFFEPTLRERYGVTEEGHVLLDALQAAGISPDEVDVVVLSHLHFDHAGGLLSAWSADTPPTLVFPAARIVVSAPAWERAQHPHARDRASFIPALHELLVTSGRLDVLPATPGPAPEPLGPAYRLHFSDGHTPGLMLLEARLPDGPLVFAGDLVPGMAWVHAPITMGYDRFPERLIDEKVALLEDLSARGGRLFFTHDPTVVAASVARDGRGRFVPVPVAPEAAAGST